MKKRCFLTENSVYFFFKLYPAISKGQTQSGALRLNVMLSFFLFARRTTANAPQTDRKKILLEKGPENGNCTCPMQLRAMTLFRIFLFIHNFSSENNSLKTQ